MDRKIIDAHVIRWEISDVKWGVVVRYDDQTRDSWPVGDRKAAEGELPGSVGSKLRYDLSDHRPQKR
jgi:hypothetical protein